MSLNHSPSIVTNGLVMYYDMNNTQKSWKGTPTTNSITNADTMTNWPAYYRTITSSTFTTEFNTTAHRFIHQPSWNGIQKSISIPSTGIYTFSARFRYLGGSSANNGATVYISGWGGGDSAAGLDKSKIGVWQRISVTLNCTNTAFTFYLISYGGTDSGTVIPDWSSWEVTMPQIEPGSYATPFVAGTRSNTQAIVDLTNNNTLTANSLTYPSDGTFSFDGTSNYISSPSFFINSDPIFSINMWIRRTADFSNGGYWGLGGGLSNNGINGYTSVANKIGWDLWGQTTFHTGVDYPLNQWVNVCWVKTSTSFTTSTLKIYINGVDTPLSTTIRNNSSLVNVISGITLGRLSDSTALYYAPGNISNTQIYNRVISAAEVLQNFNALRGRYGI